MKILTLLIMFITVFFNDKAPGTTNYNPKPLQKNLEKLGMCSGFIKQELQIPAGIGQGYIAGKFYRVHCNQSTEMYVYIGRVNSCRAGGCSVDGSAEEFEFFDYYVIYDSLINVLHVNVYNYEATHGQEITSRGWLRQFIGYNKSSNIQSGKNIDAISGATISVNGIIEDIKDKTSILSDLKTGNSTVNIYNQSR